MKKHINFFVAFFLIIFCSKKIISQTTNKLSFGNSLSLVSDWKKQPLRFFNPEISYSKDLRKGNSLFFAIQSLYAKRSSKELTAPPGTITSRLFFGIDIGYSRIITKNLSFNFGPSFRYRNEMKILYYYPPPPNSFEVVFDPKRGNFDIGAFANLKYDFRLRANSFISLKATYRVFNHGVNIPALGLFYSRHFVKKLIN